MVKDIKYALLGLLLLITFQIYSQQRIANGLEVGKQIPDIVLKQFYNQPNKSVKLSGIKKQLIILDFWNIWCSACIKSFPKLDSLQKEFGDKIEIILVTTNSSAEVKKILSKAILKNVTLPIITGDATLSKLFPYESVPHHVWINDRGIIEYITYGYNTSRKNITEYLSGKKPILSYKKDDINVDFSKPLWAKENQPLDRDIKYYSYFSGWLSEYGGGGKSRFNDSILKRVGLRFINEPLLSLCQIAFGGFDGGDFTYANRMILDVYDPQQFFSPSNEHDMDAWNAQNLVCYEIAIPFSKQPVLFQMMQQDLNRYLQYSVKVEKRKINCLLLVKTSNQDQLKSFKNSKRTAYTNDSLIIEGGSFSSEFVRRLKFANSSLHTPVVDETSYDGKVDIRIASSLSDIASLRKELKKYDLDLIEGVREIEMLIINEKNTCCVIHNRY